MFCDPPQWLQGLLWLDYSHKDFFQLFQLMPFWTLLLRFWLPYPIGHHTHLYLDTLWVRNHVSYPERARHNILHQILYGFRNRWSNHSSTKDSWLVYLNFCLHCNLLFCHVWTAPENSLHYWKYYFPIPRSAKFRVVYHQAILQYTCNYHLLKSQLLYVDLSHQGSLCTWPCINRWNNLCHQRMWGHLWWLWVQAGATTETLRY